MGNHCLSVPTGDGPPQKKDREIPYESFCAMLASKVEGGGKVDYSNLHSVMVQLFGEHASGKSKIGQALQDLGGKISSFFSGHQQSAAAAAAGVAGAAAAGPAGSMPQAASAAPDQLHSDVGILFTGCQVGKSVSEDLKLELIVPL